MGRPRKYWTDAERQKAYRQRLSNGKAIAKRYEMENGKSLFREQLNRVTKLRGGDEY